MEIKLAGFNIDREAIEDIKKILSNEKLSEEDRFTALDILSNLSPEPIVASYARISRDPRPIKELREDARKDVKGSRKSNKAIIFTMGHKSVAEHARFNYDIVGVSRRAVEAIEQNRLDSYTEKSQRYILMNGDFVLPNEIKGTKFESRFLELIEAQNAFYKNGIERITNWHNSQDYSELYPTVGAKDEEGQKGVREGLGKEDARYSLSLATQAQIGSTFSARTLETLITRLRSSPSEELQEIGRRLFEEVDGIAPSVIKYIEPTDYFAKTRPELAKFVSELVTKEKESRLIKEMPIRIESDRVKLFTGLKRDDAIIAGLIFSSSNLPYNSCLELTGNMGEKEKVGLLNQTIKYQEKHDPMLREYELGDRIAEMVMSSSAFAQIKRHRMDAIIPQKYDIRLGTTYPKSVLESGLQDELKRVVDQSSNLYNDLVQEGYPPQIAEYVLTNSHRRRVLFDANNRQVHAFCMERENLAAQWDIRATANEYHQLIKDKAGDSYLTTRALCGKHEFNDLKERLLSGD